MTTPITELSLVDLLAAASASFESTDEAEQWDADVQQAMEKRWNLARAVALAQDMVNRAEVDTKALPAHWKEAHGELTRLRRELNEVEGDILMLRSELERRVRRVRTGGGK